MPAVRPVIELAACIFAAAVFLLSISGCPEDDALAIRHCRPDKCPDTCSGLSRGLCDISKKGCQETIFDAVQCVRGTSGQMPPVKTITKEEYREHLEDYYRTSDEVALDGGVGDGEPTDAGSPHRNEPDAGDQATRNADGGAPDESEQKADSVMHWQAALSLLGLMPPADDFMDARIDIDVDNILGFYSSKDKAITLIDNNLQLDDDGAMLRLAHEFVHALQDQEVGLIDFTEREVNSTDTSISRGCLIEGEAELYQDLAWALLNEIPVEDLFWEEGYDTNLKYDRRRVLVSTAPFDAAVGYLWYTIGGRYTKEAWLHNGNWEVQSLYDSLPSSSIYWMVGYEANQGREEHWQLPLACWQATAPRGYEVYDHDTFGPLILFTFLGIISERDEVFASEKAWNDALQWRGDRIFVFYEEATSATAVSWRIRFQDRNIARYYESRIAQNERNLDLRPVVRGDELEIMASDDGEVLDEWEGTDPDGCPEEQ